MTLDLEKQELELFSTKQITDEVVIETISQPSPVSKPISKKLWSIIAGSVTVAVMLTTMWAPSLHAFSHYVLLYVATCTVIGIGIITFLALRQIDKLRCL